ncbi:hypothetical protein [Paenibacillus sp. MMS18-CY102]|uniref:hypothetical protein n=1 Tax=Paenibacillus sp. MMS18-CY102 TaxID=2682849 RepID=UPI0013663CBB|nr:hypothetical protein [Paenibacillus sp. MMS18-CY102]MWC27123.1 hypothetical protein [Paenibacillus sp. MMS18-CY102]
MKKLKKLSTLIVVAALTIPSTVSAATVHELGYSAVDSSEIRWGGSTKYSTAWSSAVTAWNALNKVVIAPDTVWSIEDLTISDISEESDEPFTAQYINSIGADELEFNTFYMDASYRTAAHNQNTAMHELGHALGIGDHEGAAYNTNIMYYAATSETTIKNHEKDDYNNIHS